MQYRLRTLLIALALAPPLVAYLGSYYVLSRRGYSYADSVGTQKVFFFAHPQSDVDGRIHGHYQRFYWSLIQLELILGTGRSPFNGTRGIS